METDELVKNAVKQETYRIEEDCEHSAKSHFNTSTIWGSIHNCIGIPMTILAAMVAICEKDKIELLYISIIVAVLAALQTFLDPSKKENYHEIAGNTYLSLRNKTRIFREIELLTDDRETAKEKINILADTRDKLNKETAQPMWLGFVLAKFDIDCGRTKYLIDKECK